VGARVTFHPEDHDRPYRPSGIVGTNGVFKLSTFMTNDGAPEGRYKISVYWPRKTKSASLVIQVPGEEAFQLAQSADGEDLLGNLFNDADKSGLTADVKKQESNVLQPFALDRAIAPIP
jgi:hypothetical protein